MLSNLTSLLNLVQNITLLLFMIWVGNKAAKPFKSSVPGFVYAFMSILIGIICYYIGIIISSNYLPDLPFGLSDFINKAIEEGYCVRNVDVKGDYWTEIDTLEDLEKVLQGNRRIVVERVLNNLRRTTLSPLTEIQTKIT